MSKPNFIPDSDWNLVLSYARDFANEEYLIAAIGWHETNWNTNPKSPKDYHLGYGYYTGSPILAKVKGLENQLKYACAFIKTRFVPPITLKSVTDFAVNHWRSSAPTSWARSVYSIYTGLIEGVAPVTPVVPEEIPTGEVYLTAQVTPSDIETINLWKAVFDKIFAAILK